MAVQVPLPCKTSTKALPATTAKFRCVRPILYAWLNRGWIINPVSEGVIDGKILLRGHSADIRITYSTNRYQIRHVGSNNMDAKEGKIHSNYNRWVANLNKDIQLELARQNIK
ncbi:Uncharacterised protein [Serratia plymuthica]|uniref:Uncharacterized protein n=1 Tax=Serratia plymuthica TaxID=82996 RepID=A0A2X4X6N8_SERPL|nr:Uncharacterised protein [Serratia plymuthica]